MPCDWNATVQVHSKPSPNPPAPGLLIVDFAELPEELNGVAIKVECARRIVYDWILGESRDAQIEHARHLIADLPLI
jgi:hypothetical protein